MPRITRRAALALPGLLIARGAAAQERPLRIVVPFPPGGTSDLLARILQPELQRLLGQAVVIDNRGGAAGNLGADHVAKSAPDGTTVLLTDPGILTTSPSLFARLPYDPANDLAPVTALIYAPYIMAVHPSVPARNAQEFAAYVRANPGRINFAHSGVGALNHLTALVVVGHWGGEVTEVFYRGGMLGIQAAVANESQMVVNGATATLPFVREGQLRALAVSGPRRMPELPDVPSFAELGWPAADAGIWQGLLAPARTPAAVIARLHRGFAEALDQPAVRERLTTLGAQIRAEGPESFRAFLARETELWSGVIRARGIKLD